MAKARKAVLVWRSSPRTWHDLPLDTSGLFLRQFILPDNIPPGIRLKYYPRHVFFVFSRQHHILSLVIAPLFLVLFDPQEPIPGNALVPVVCYLPRGLRVCSLPRIGFKTFPEGQKWQRNKQVEYQEKPIEYLVSLRFAFERKNTK